MADESHQNSSIFGTGAVYARGTVEPVPTPLGSRRRTIHGGVTLDGETRYISSGKADDRSFIRYLSKPRHRFGKAAVVVDNAAYHNLGLVRSHPERSDDSIKLIFLPPYSPFLNPGKWQWRNGKAEMRRTFRRPAKSYFRGKIMSVYASLGITFNPRNIPFRNLDKILPA